MANPIPVPLTGPININNIKAAFPSTNSNNYKDYENKPWYKPSDGTSGVFPANGPIDDYDFRGKMEGFVIHISSDTYNVYLKSLIPNYVQGHTGVICYVDPGVKVGSTNPNSPAFVIDGFYSGDAVSLTNNGSIIGAGGNAGSDAGGGPGGDALSLNYPTKLVNNGTLAGGGGGGGSGSGGSTYGGCCGCGSVHYNGGSGGGGAGFNPGLNATLTVGGAPDSQNGTTGGPGGNLGQPGTGSSGGGGGPAGAYIRNSGNIIGGVGSIGGTVIGNLG